MKLTLFNALLISIDLSILVSCENDQCRNLNPIFDRYKPQEEVYKQELAKQINATNPARLFYSLNRYEVKNGKEYLNIHIQCDSFCATAMVLVMHWDDKMEGIKRTKGVSYGGAGLAGLQIDIRQDSAIQFIYKSLDYILD